MQALALLIFITTASVGILFNMPAITLVQCAIVSVWLVLRP